MLLRTTRRGLFGIVLTLLLTLPLSLQAATLSTAQLQTLKTYIGSQPDLSVQPNNSDGNTEVARLLNLASTPANTAIGWRTAVTINEVGKSFNATELAGLTSLNHTRLQTLAIYLAGGVNPSLATVRQFFDDIFSGAGGVNTRAALLALWKRTMTRGERLYATGTGSDASPATLVVEGSFTAANINAALALP